MLCPLKTAHMTAEVLRIAPFCSEGTEKAVTKAQVIKFTRQSLQPLSDRNQKITEGFGHKSVRSLFLLLKTIYFTKN